MDLKRKLLLLCDDKQIDLAVQDHPIVKSEKSILSEIGLLSTILMNIQDAATPDADADAEKVGDK